jgi:hypothetical protein
MFNFQSLVNPMKEVRAYIQPFALGSLLQSLDETPIFSVTVSEHEGFGRKNIEPGDGKVYVIDGSKDGRIWRGGYAA